MDIYVKSVNPDASDAEITRTGHIVTVFGALVSIVLTVAIDNIKGLDLFNVFQSVLGFIAPPMAAVFLLGVFWKRCTTLAANLTLTFGTFFSIGIGILYLWTNLGIEWPHFMLLSFYIFAALCLGMVCISLFDKTEEERHSMRVIEEKTSVSAITAWVVLAAVMVFLYIYFN